jgi:hypothetical protein
MSRFSTICLRAVLAPVHFWHGRSGARCDAAPRPAYPSPDQRTADGPAPEERLERIALYARAGYFRMGGPLDMMNMTGEIPLE